MITDMAAKWALAALYVDFDRVMLGIFPDSVLLCEKSFVCPSMNIATFLTMECFCLCGWCGSSSDVIDRFDESSDHSPRELTE